MNVYKLKQEMCEIGRRIYNRGFAAANDGNITYRISEKEVLCTPTLICKGFMTPNDICSVDMEGKQLSGKRKRTSEVLLHLAIMKERPEVKSVVHCHPPHATAFAIAREPIPQCVLPEVEVFLGDVPITKYETPGGQVFADTIIPFWPILMPALAAACQVWATTPGTNVAARKPIVGTFQLTSPTSVEAPAALASGCRRG